MALALMFVIVFMAYGLMSLIGKSIDASKARKLAETEEASLRQKEGDLSDKISALGTADGKEAVLREEFPVVKPGERMVVVTDSTAASASIQTAAAANANTRTGFWDFFRNIFKK